MEFPRKIWRLLRRGQCERLTLMSTIQSPLPPTETERRVTLLATGGVAGFAIWTSSLILAYLWRSTIFGGLEAWQGSNWWQLWVWAMAMYGGLAIMFISLMPARAVAHSNVALRRLLYGYNAVLTGQLVLSILLFVNVLVYNYYTASYDWTESSIYTLTDRSKSILRALDKPTRVYALVPASDDLVYREIHTLLDNCRAIRGTCVEVFWMYSAHAQWYASHPPGQPR